MPTDDDHILDVVPPSEATAPARATPRRRSPTLMSTSLAGSCRALERARQQLPRQMWTMPLPFVIDATYASFRLDGLAVTADQVTRALSHRQSVRAFRSGMSPRVRVHAAIMKSSERLVRRNAPLKVSHLLRWYTGLCGGLTTMMPDGLGSARVGTILSRINNPPMLLTSAVGQIVEVHNEVLRDGVVPSFNGITARLLLNLHLGRCGLLPVIFEPALDDPVCVDPAQSQMRLLALLVQRYELAGVL